MRVVLQEMIDARKKKLLIRMFDKRQTICPAFLVRYSCDVSKEFASRGQTISRYTLPWMACR